MSAPARRSAVLVVALLLAALVGPLPARAAPQPAVPVPADGLEITSETRPVAPGLDLTSFDRYGVDGWLRADALAADLSGGLSVDYLNSGAVAGTAPLREQADEAGAVAAVNGDFFDINNSGAAEGIGIQGGELVQSPIAGHHQAVSITAEGVGEVVEAYFEGSPAGEQTSIAVTVGLEPVVVADFADADRWWYDSVPADVPGFVEPAEGRDGPGLRLSADFSQHTVTRAAYANPPAFIDVPGQPRAFVMGIHGNGNGEWASLHLVDANGSDVVLRGPNVTWTGWQEVRLEVPDGVAYPVQIRRFYAPEIRADAAYQSELILDEIVALVPPEVDRPPAPVVPDPVIGTGAEVAGADWRFAVMADAQFTSDNPESDIVAQTRRTLREIKAAEPDFLVINGDFVDRAWPADFALAKRILDEELAGELPYYYVPGNHEIMGAPIDNFRAVFGDTYRVFDHKGTRFVTLNTATGLLRSEFDQLRELRRALDEAATDPAIESVAVLQHHPPRDIQPTAPSQLSDRKEAAVLERWLAEFERTTGKEALFVGAHAGYFHASRVDGVPYLNVGNSGKDPATPPEAGGFTGWALVGADPFTVQVRPHVDELTVDMAQTAPVGVPLPVTATVTQGGVEVPATWPVSVDWSASAGVHVGPGSGVRPRHVAWFDPATGTFTALRPAGIVVLSATVNGETVHTRIQLAPASP